jgi:hypothetical protein
MTGVLLILLWRGTKFWLSAFPDGRHLSGIFRTFKKMRIKTRSWGLSPKDAFAGSLVFFLALEVDCRGSGRAESVITKERCFVWLFGKECLC